MILSNANESLDSINLLYCVLYLLMLNSYFDHWKIVVSICIYSTLQIPSMKTEFFVQFHLRPVQSPNMTNIDVKNRSVTHLIR